MAVNPICIYSFILLDNMTPLTYWRSNWNGSAWSSPPTKVFDSTPTAANFTYIQSAGFTKDGTHLGISLSHAVPSNPPDATELTFCGDGFPTAVDASSGNTLSAPWAQLASIRNPYGAWFFNSTYYMIAVDTHGSAAIRILTSATGANPWTEIDAAHHPVINSGNPQVGTTSTFRCTVTVPSKIDFFFSVPGGNQVFLQTFDLLSGKWSTPYGLLTLPVATFYFPEDVVRFPNGDLAGISLVQAPGGSLHWSYRIFNGISWGSEIMLPIGTSGSAYKEAIVDPATPDVMSVWAENNPFSPTATFSLYAATHFGVVTGPLFTTRQINDFASGGMGHGISINGVQYVPITDTNLTTDSVWIGSGTSFTETFLPIPPGDQGIGPEVAGYMIDFLASAPPPFPPSMQPGSPCTASGVGSPQTTDVFFELRRVYATMKPAPRIPTRGS